MKGARGWLVACGALALVALGCTHGRGPAESGGDLFDDDLAASDVPDPLEPVNRPVFAVNEALDRALLDPLARFYGWIAPDPVKHAVRGVFANLNSPAVFVNQVLQLDPERAAGTLGRFVLNSTLGFGGLFDPASEAGLVEHHADFGQTLGKAGIGPGCYLVLPLLGPSTARDTVGTMVDLLLRIDTWFLPISSQFLIGGGFGITEREDKRDEIEALRKSSIDFYAAIRSAYLQSRAALVREARER